MLVLNEVIKEQLRIRVEVRVRAVRRGGHEAVNLHGAVVAKVEVEFVARDSDLGDWRAALGDGPDTAEATEPVDMSTLYAIEYEKWIHTRS